MTVTFWFFSVTLVLFNCFLQTFGSFSALLAFIKALMFSSLSFLMHIKHTIDIDVFFVNDVTGHLKMVVLQRLELFSVHPVGEYFGFNHKNMQFQALQF